ncbi:hypothetical protein CAPTEDRAFT_186482 [Capitella teleta]|uniref:Uncharacterized protein n=1 Tax=Capitella teleta TaxID=283909 RepID=R7TXM3_CAPTE|nr:hypothetical protein CAPTEDRAFT_186482 [Capitella teleta]|eukprot:ELT98322.1 hypothetical protein CAPTEDRAFT_186482 [Capitella teleta]
MKMSTTCELLNGQSGIDVRFNRILVILHLTTFADGSNSNHNSRITTSAVYVSVCEKADLIYVRRRNSVKMRYSTFIRMKGAAQQRNRVIPSSSWWREILAWTRHSAIHLDQTPGDLQDWLKTMSDHDWEAAKQRNVNHNSLKSFFVAWRFFCGSINGPNALLTQTRQAHNFPASWLLLEFLRYLKAKTIILSPEMEDEFKEFCDLIAKWTNLERLDIRWIEMECEPRKHSFGEHICCRR